MLVHDANLGREALARGCADLVVGGHLHVQVGPTRVVGANGRAGYTYTNGTTGGAAYAIAVGSKPRRDAEVTLVTYRDGRPVGLQPVVLQTDGRLRGRATTCRWTSPCPCPRPGRPPTTDPAPAGARPPLIGAPGPRFAPPRDRGAGVVPGALGLRDRAAARPGAASRDDGGGSMSPGDVRSPPSRLCG